MKRTTLLKFLLVSLIAGASLFLNACGGNTIASQENGQNSNSGAVAPQDENGNDVENTGATQNAEKQGGGQSSAQGSPATAGTPSTESPDISKELFRRF